MINAAMQTDIANYQIAGRVGNTLHKHYPDHAWSVMADIEQGIVYIKNLALSGEWGFVLKMNDLQKDPTMKIVINAGGELLERFYISRGRMKEHELEGRKITLRGTLNHDG